VILEIKVEEASDAASLSDFSSKFTRTIINSYIIDSIGHEELTKSQVESSQRETISNDNFLKPPG